MVQIQLYVENDQGVLEEVELYKDESVTLTQSIQEVTDIEKLFTDYSKTFNVPASKTNNKFFKHFYNYNIEGFDGRRKKVAELHLNYKPFKKGKIKLEGVQMKNNEPHTYKLTFFGNTITIKDLFGDDKLTILSNLNRFNFVYNDTNIEAYLSNGLDQNLYDKQINDAIIFPLISHTHRWVYSSDSGYSYNLNPDVSSDAYGLHFNQLKPAIRVYAIIKAIEAQYRLEFSEDFFNQTNSDFYNLYLWLHKKEGSIFEDQDAEYSITGFSNIVGDTDKIQGVKSASFLNDFDEDKNVRTMHFRVTPSNNDPYGLIIKRDGKEFQKYDNLTGLSITGTPNDDGIIEPLVIDPGEYTFFIVSDNAATYDIEATIYNDPSSIFRSSSSITFTTSVSVLSQQSINIPSQLPDIKVIDFLSGLFKLFNLTSYINDQGVVVIQPLNDYYASSQNTWDITKYLDKDSTTVDSVIPYKQVNLQYDKTETFLAKNHKYLANKEWGQLLFKESEKFEGDTYEIKVPFEHMKFEHLIDLSDGTTQSNILWGWAADVKQESTATEPILFYATKNTGTTVAAVNLAGTRRDIDAPYMPSNTNGLGSVDYQSLNFHQERDEWTFQPNPKTLFKTYYEDYIKDLFDKRKRITFVSAYLPLAMTEKLSLADQVVIFDRTYKINKITTNFETNKSELELINELQPRVYFEPAATTTLTISDDNITADSTYITADQGSEANDGFDTPEVTQEIPDPDHEGNDITNDEVSPCVVTPATITYPQSLADCDQITFSAVINSAGSICEFKNIDEYGFLLSSNSSYLIASDDIDTLKADSNIEVRAVYRQETSLVIGEKSTIKTGLTDPATYYARFYVRTNTQDRYEKADAISNLITETTVCVQDDRGIQLLVAQAGIGNHGWSTIPTYQDIVNRIYSGKTVSGLCGETFGFSSNPKFNGLGEYPVVGDKVKTTEYSDYTGGTNSFPEYFTSIFNTNGYFAWGIGNLDDAVQSNNRTYMSNPKYFIVVEFATAEVVAVYDCETKVIPQEETQFLFLNAGTLYQGYDSIPTISEIEANTSGQVGKEGKGCGDIILTDIFYHNGTTRDPKVGDYIKSDTKKIFGLFKQNYGQQYKKYSVFAVGDWDQKQFVLGTRYHAPIIKYIVFDPFTGEIVEVLSCP